MHWRLRVITGLSVVALLLALLILINIAQDVYRTGGIAPAAPTSTPAEQGIVSDAQEQPAPASAQPPTPTPRRSTSAPQVLTTTPQPPTPSPQAAFFDGQHFSYAPDFYEPEIQAFLDAQPGPLREVRFQIGDRSQSFAEVLVNFSNLYSFNPKILLALIEQQSQLLSAADPAPEQLDWAMGFQGENERKQGLYSQLYWSVVTLRRAVADYANYPPEALPDLVFEDDEEQPVPPDISLTRYAIARVLARTTTPDNLPAAMNDFLATYTRLFGDPRLPPEGWPPRAEPFLYRPFEKPFRVTSFFDHETPFLKQNGSLVSFWGTTEVSLSYDGHTGWDYALKPPDPILAAADGRVVFAGNSDDGCGFPARGVIIDHGNGYRTLYWHLSVLQVEAGEEVRQGTQIGIAGATGCAFGPHLHFQVQYLGRDVDPYGWCGSSADPWADNPAGARSTWLWADMPNPCGPPPPSTVVVDDTSPGFVRSGEWQRSDLGYGTGALYTATSWLNSEREPWELRRLVNTPALAVWQPDLPGAGSYRVMAYIPYVLNGLDDSRALRYRVHHSEGQTEIIVDGEAAANAWADLGTYRFDPAERPRVSVSTLAGDEARGLWADAVAWIPVQ